MAFSLGSDSQTGNIYAVCQLLCRRTYSSNAMATPFLETLWGVKMFVCWWLGYSVTLSIVKIHFRFFSKWWHCFRIFAHIFIISL